MSNEKKVEHLIVDTTAFIQNVQLQELGNNIITDPNVVNEIKSRRQLKRLVVLPYELKVQEAFPEDVKFVTEFAKKTGDYISLSATDIKVIALTYRLEKEKVGTEHLKTEPKIVKTIDSSKVSHDGPTNQLPGFYMPQGKERMIKRNAEKIKTKKVIEIKPGQDDDFDSVPEKTEDKQEDSDSMPELSDNEDTEPPRKTATNGQSKPDEDSMPELSDDEEAEQTIVVIEKSDNEQDSMPELSDNEEERESEYDTAHSEAEDSIQDYLAKQFESLSCDATDLEVDCKENFTIDDILPPISKFENRNFTDSSESEEDDEGWITPSNIASVKKQMDSAVFHENPATVACLTTDFAMQNVLMQMGLNIASLDGRVIKQMRTFILRCCACFKTTSIMTKVFCPNCGNKSLKKVSVSVDDDGNQKIHINYKKVLSTKGKKFSLPTYQGGKHASNPILYEDQPMPDQRATKLANMKTEALNDDYIAGYSPFVMRDVNSKSAMLGIRPGLKMKHWMKKNPNECRKRRK